MTMDFMLQERKRVVAKETPTLRSHRFSLLINSLINFLDRTDFEVSQRPKLRFYRSNSLMLFCSPLHVHFSTVKHLLLDVVF